MRLDTMASDTRFGILRNVLRAFGLPQEAVDDIVNWIADLLAGKSEAAGQQAPEFPYHLRPALLSPAELCFYETLKLAVGERAVVNAKVGLGDIFMVKSDDQSRYRIYTNKIDRKHVDFLLCDPKTMRPLVGIELDDKSHQRADRQARDKFIDKVYRAAGLPILHVPAKRSYTVGETEVQVAPYLSAAPVSLVQAVPVRAELPSISAPTPQGSPRCPKCGGEMVLRTAKSGANAGGQFWGCASYPGCRSRLPFKL